ncbi:MAG: retroviral-like aspartic protease family protein [Candidatus Rokubacteria bacterium]|nr:retroviral-like aspartic protease family protein [Candidatus Rokubacteria bacterium]
MPAYQLPPWGGPLAPLSTLTVSWGLGRERVRAVLDSGADYTQVPTRVVRALGLRRVGERNVETADERRRQVLPTYIANIELENVVFEGVVIIGSDDFTPNGDAWALVGRDILNEAVVLDGPSKSFTVSAPTRRPASG